MKLASLFSGGKDSALSLYMALKEGHEIKTLITVVSSNPESYMFHVPNIELAHLQAEAMEIPIIVLTAVSDIRDKVDMLELGIEDYIMKPFNFIEILARIRNVLKVGAIRDELKAYEKKLEFIDDFQKSLNLFLESVQSLSRDMIEWGEKELHRSGGKTRGSENADPFVRKVVRQARHSLKESRT